MLTSAFYSACAVSAFALASRARIYKTQDNNYDMVTLLTAT